METAPQTSNLVKQHRTVFAKMIEAQLVAVKDAEQRARAIFAAIAGSQLLARSRSDISIFNSIIQS